MFLIPSRFYGVNSIKNDDEDPYLAMSAQIPKLLRSEAEQQLIEGLGSGSQTVVLTAIVVPCVAGVALKGVMSKLWAMLNTY